MKTRLPSLCQRRAGVVADLAGCASVAGYCPPPKACMRSIAPPLQTESPIRFELREFPLFLLDSVRLTWLATGQRKTAAAFLQLLSLCWRRAGVGMGFTGFVFSITVKAEKTRMRSALPPFQIESPIRFELREFPLFLLGSICLTWLATGQKNSSRVSAAAVFVLAPCYFPGPSPAKYRRH